MIRTDLALEAQELYRENAAAESAINGVETDISQTGNVSVTKIRITNENGASALGKPVGTYVTVEAPDLKFNEEDYETACRLAADAIREMLSPKPEQVTLVVGLGNREVTPDALGPAAVDRLMITTHMKKHMPEYLGDSIGGVCAIIPGVLGTTGLESSEIVGGVVKEAKPDAVIAIDALAARSPDRLSTTIQIGNTGIRPGAGIGNRRGGLSEEALGVPVIAIGVPTVIDASTIVQDTVFQIVQAIEESKLPEQDREMLIAKTLSQSIDQMMVTPKDIDLIIERAAKTVANSINLALHRDLSFEDIENYVG